MLVCTHCKSQSVVYDREYVAGTGYVDRPRCLMCGRDKFEIQECSNIEISKNIKSDHESGSSPMQTGESISQKPEKEEPMDEFFEKHGITFDEYKANKRYKCESPARVVARMKSDKAGPLDIFAKVVEDPRQSIVSKAAEDIHTLLSEKEKPEIKSHAKRLVLDVPMTEITIKVPTSAVQNGITFRVNWTE